MKVRLRYILFVAFTLISIVPVVFLTYWVQNSALDKELQAVEEKHLLLARNLTGALSRYVTDVSETFRVTTNILNEQATLPKHLSGLLTNMDIRVVANLDIETQSSRVIVGDESALPANLFSAIATELNSAADVSTILFTGVKANTKGEPMVYLLRRGVLHDFFVAGLGTDFIIEVQQNVSFGRKGHAAIVDGTGRVLAHPNSDWRLAMKDISKISSVKLMMAGKTGVTTFYSPAVKADMIAGYAVVPKVGWGVMIPQPYQELVDKAGGVRLAALGFASLGISVAALISWWLAGVIASPIMAVVKSARELAQGQKGQINEIRVSGAEELKELATAFNAMAKDVLSARKNLEQKVADRTRELSDEIAQRIIIEDKIRHLASHDSLTGIQNRAQLMDRLQMGLAESRRRKEQIALLFLDLDRFKPVNDQFGHHVGDVVLKAVALRLVEATREVDTVARYGGDEFVIVLVGCEDIEGVADEILACLSHPFHVEEHTISIGVSIGVAVSQDGAKTPKAMLHEADHAMYKAKKAGGNRIILADSVG